MGRSFGFGTSCIAIMKFDHGNNEHTYINQKRLLNMKVYLD